LPNIRKLVAQFVSEPAESEEKVEREFYLCIISGGSNIGVYNGKNKRPENSQTFFCLKTFFELYA
jgi:hypothetical protein